MALSDYFQRPIAIQFAVVLPDDMSPATVILMPVFEMFIGDAFQNPALFTGDTITYGLFAKDIGNVF